MLTHTLSNGDVLGLVETLESVCKVWIEKDFVCFSNLDTYHGGRALPPGTWQLIGNTVAAGLTEEEWAEALGCEYLPGYDHTSYPPPPPSEQGYSLLKSKDLNPSTNVLIIQKVKP